MSIALMAVAGFIVGFALDALVARLAREPFERGAFDENDPDVSEQPASSTVSLDLSSEHGAVELPRLLTTASPYRRAVIVALTTALFAIVGRQYAGDEWAMIATALCVTAFVGCAATDIIAYRVPNVITYPAILGSLAVGLAFPYESRWDVVFGGLLFGGLLFVPSILTGGGMGMGDVKLAAFVGFALGLTLVLPAMLIMALGGGLAALFLLVTRIRGKRDPIPYAPFISGGALVVLLIRGSAFASV